MTDPATESADAGESELLPWLVPLWARLMQARAADRLPHALLIAGARGLGKRRFADLFVRALLCTAPDPQGLPCGRCPDCRLHGAGNHPDLVCVVPDPESKSGEITIDAIRDLSERAALTPLRGTRKLVLIDPAMLSTLPPKEIRCGLAEVVKYGVILDPELFAKLEQNIQKLNAPDLQFYPEIIARCCELKAQVVAADERESGLRGILNYGHTFGHAVELNSNFTVAHGEGVAIGMNMAAELAVQSGLLDRAAADRQRELLEKLSLPCRLHSGGDPEKIYAGMLKDKKKVGSRLNMVIPLAIGKVEIKSGFEPAAIIKAIRCCCD